MIESDKPVFAQCVKQLSVLHRTVVSDALLKAYWEALVEMPIEDFNRAYKHLIKHGQWFPKPAEFWAARRQGWM